MTRITLIFLVIICLLAWVVAGAFLIYLSVYFEGSFRAAWRFNANTRHIVIATPFVLAGGLLLLYALRR